MSTARQDRFLSNLRSLQDHAGNTGWFQKVRESLSHQIGLVEWNGWVAHATAALLHDTIVTEGFKANVKEHSRTGRACYFFPGACSGTRDRAVRLAEEFFYLYSPAREEEGLVFEAEWKTFHMLVARGEEWDILSDSYLLLFNELVTGFRSLDRPPAELYFATRQLQQAVPWTLLAEALPHVECVSIDSDKPSPFQGDDAPIEILGIFSDCRPPGLNKVKHLYPRGNGTSGSPL